MNCLGIYGYEGYNLECFGLIQLEALAKESRESDGETHIELNIGQHDLVEVTVIPSQSAVVRFGRGFRFNCNGRSTVLVVSYLDEACSL